MAAPLATLTTDFGAGSPYVAAMKGVLLRGCPTARIVDLSHDLPPQDLVQAAFFLRETLPWFPSETLHVAVVDPEVGTARRILLVVHPQYRLLAPDNGIWTWLPESEAATVYSVINPAWQRAEVSATFHGRDRFAPAVGQLLSGAESSLAGPAIRDWKKLPMPQCSVHEGQITGEILFVDAFGNAITNIPWSAAVGLPGRWVEVQGRPILRQVRTYADAKPGDLIWLASSSGWLEIAQVQGSAAKALGLSRGTPVLVSAE